jgi:hypothetical protein
LVTQNGIEVLPAGYMEPVENQPQQPYYRNPQPVQQIQYIPVPVPVYVPQPNYYAPCVRMTNNFKESCANISEGMYYLASGYNAMRNAGMVAAPTISIGALLLKSILKI